MGLLGESCGAGLDFSSQDNIDYERLCVVMVLAVVTSVNQLGLGVELGLGVIGCVCFFSFLLSSDSRAE